MVCLFIRGLFNNGFIKYHCVASNDVTID